MSDYRGKDVADALTQARDHLTAGLAELRRAQRLFARQDRDPRIREVSPLLSELIGMVGQNGEQTDMLRTLYLAAVDASEESRMPRQERKVGINGEPINDLEATVDVLEGVDAPGIQGMIELYATTNHRGPIADRDSLEYLIRHLPMAATAKAESDMQDAVSRSERHGVIDAEQARWLRELRKGIRRGSVQRRADLASARTPGEYLERIGSMARGAPPRPERRAPAARPVRKIGRPIEIGDDE